MQGRLGEIRYDVLSDGRFRLDGGAMFGVVPKPAWEKRLPADEHNRVELGLNCLLLQLPDGRRLLADTGVGDRWEGRSLDELGLVRESTLVEQLQAHGLEPGDIDLVACSHLHFDHAGGNVRKRSDGKLVPAFPKARYLVQRAEWHDAGCPHERNRASYRPDDFAPLEDAGQLELLDGDTEVAPGVFLDLTPGHCPGMQVLRVVSGGQTLVYPADLMPTSAHVRPAWNMGYDLDVTATVAAKRELVARALEGDWILCFDHDAALPLARLRKEDRNGRQIIAAVPLGMDVTA
jgi:glyoxylase-like metal-dependent hydrolase (beta-lactamase superfamily II)